MSATPEKNSRVEQSAASDDSIQQVHAQLQKTKPEKKDGYSMLPLVLLGLICTVVFFGSVYMVHYSIRFDPLVVNEVAKREKPGASKGVQLTRAQMGKRVYDQTCFACHGPAGLGQPGTYPPLAGSEWAQGSEERVIRIVLHGLSGPLMVEGKEYNNVMAPLGGTLKDEQIANVISYVRASWGNTASEVQPETVAKVRAETADRKSNWTAAELEKL
ncbi:c-type cytochrome [Oleiharenicola lentus]|uniref:c-type cytochrome n=1 Tax=Oleiharenicola lentus TaxID=2508720 RepID=UPI003F66BD63